MRLAHAPRAVEVEEVEEDEVADGAPIKRRSKIAIDSSTGPLSFLGGSDEGIGYQSFASRFWKVYMVT